jgi:hypothetical protein
MHLRPAALLVISTVIAVSVVAGSHAFEEIDRIAFPREFRDWAVVKSSLIGPEHPSFAQQGGLSHTYANPIALAGYRSGTFGDGAVIVFELLETHDAGGLVTEGKRRRLDVMVRSSERFATTGGWGFESFSGTDEDTGTVGDQAATKCSTCHAKPPAKGFVFSTLRQ